MFQSYVRLCLLFLFVSLNSDRMYTTAKYTKILRVFPSHYDDGKIVIEDWYDDNLKKFLTCASELADLPDNDLYLKKLKQCAKLSGKTPEVMEEANEIVHNRIDRQFKEKYVQLILQDFKRGRRAALRFNGPIKNIHKVYKMGKEFGLDPTMILFLACVAQLNTDDPEYKAKIRKCADDSGGSKIIKDKAEKMAEDYEKEAKNTAKNWVEKKAEEVFPWATTFEGVGIKGIKVGDFKMDFVTEKYNNKLILNMKMDSAVLFDGTKKSNNLIV